MWDVMELDDDTLSRGSRSTTVDPDLRDEHARGASRRWAFGLAVGFDIIAIVAFVSLVVIPRLT
jgi:hypothetical protein